VGLEPAEPQQCSVCSVFLGGLDGRPLCCTGSHGYGGVFHGRDGGKGALERLKGGHEAEKWCPLPTAFWDAESEEYMSYHLLGESRRDRFIGCTRGPFSENLTCIDFVGPMNKPGGPYRPRKPLVEKSSPNNVVVPSLPPN